MISTIRSDFLDRFEDLPHLVAVRNRLGKAWTLPMVSQEGLREIISGPARLADLDVDEARDEPGALPLVENALNWLWEQRTPDGRLSGHLFNQQGGLAGVLSQSADDLLQSLGEQRGQALELLFRLVRVDPEGQRHTRRRLPLTEAVALAGGGERGHDLIYRLAGARARGGRPAQGPLRLITVAGTTGEATIEDKHGQWIDLIHETLVRARAPDAEGKPQPYWPTLWDHIERHKDRAAWRERVRVETRSWLENGRKPSYLWSHERVREAATALTQVGPAIDLDDDERAFLGPIDPAEMLAELGRPETSHERRLLIGERLDVLRDPRSGIGLRNGLPEIDWVRIEGGEVAINIRANSNDPNSLIQRTLRRSVQPFKMARYLVTVAQFQVFFDECRRDGRWHLPPGFPIDLPDTSPPRRRRWRYLNHPADTINWFDACAFCHWLGARLGTDIRLPTEFEWQLAATGGDPDRTYPWGPGWDPEREPWRANTGESGLGEATAVGCYPKGKSADGLLDIAGTVWEWCLNEFDDPETTAFRAGLHPRVARGGSCLGNRDVARCAHRLRGDPSNRSRSIGFRVMTNC